MPVTHTDSLAFPSPQKRGMRSAEHLFGLHARQQPNRKSRACAGPALPPCNPFPMWGGRPQHTQHRTQGQAPGQAQRPQAHALRDTGRRAQSRQAARLAPS